MTTPVPGPPPSSPLTEADLSAIESTLLPALERHHLRLLAHGLRTLQHIAGRREGPPPTLEVLEDWAGRLPAIADDPDFARAFAIQLQAAGRQLAQLPGAAGPGGPLALDLPELVAWAKRQADARLS